MTLRDPPDYGEVKRARDARVLGVRLVQSPVVFDLPVMRTLNDAVPAMGALVKAVGQGDLTPTEAGELTKMVQAFAKIIETAELEERVRKLEEAIDK
jgi:hypothetical protein